MRVSGDHWVDEEGRRLVLRGVNAGGDCKVPTRPDGDTRLKAGFYDGKNVSFVGRPFALDEADEHFDRLKRWGLSFLRFLVTWEAVEHEGPGLYDEEYLDYLERIVAKAGEHGLSLFIDPHQDVWSRWTGGDGAPMWTLEAAGFEPSRLAASGAALLNQELGPAYPRMRWMSNYDRLACATMWTLFFAGDSFAPGIGPIGFEVDGRERRSMQEFLQGHYFASMAKIAGRLARFPHVVGFDSLNEPSAGFIGKPSIDMRGGANSFGTTPSPWEAILAGSGRPQRVDILDIKYLVRGESGFELAGRGKVGTESIGTKGVGAWKDGVDCIWRRAGLWSEEGGVPVPKKKDYFAFAGGAPVDFTRDCLEPFIKRFGREVCAARGAASGAGSSPARFVLFVEGVPNAGRPTAAVADGIPIVDATHWYDDLTLVTKKFRGFLAADARSNSIVIGPRRVRRYFIEAIRELRDWSSGKMGGAPMMLGEFGLPFDLSGGKAYRSGDYRVHERALSAYYDAIDASLVDSTIWNYTADNRHERGDLWNTEDLSVFCRDDKEAGRTETGESADAGGRALRGFVRPYAQATAGELLEMRFDSRRGIFFLRYRPDRAIAAPTEVFVPELQFPRGFVMDTEGCDAEVSRGSILLRARAGAEEATLRITRRDRS